MRILVLTCFMSLSIFGSSLKTSMDNAVKSMKFNEVAQERIEKYSSQDKVYDYRIIDIVKLKGNSKFSVLIAKYKDGESYYDLIDILLLDEDEFYKLFNTEK